MDSMGFTQKFAQISGNGTYSQLENKWNLCILRIVILITYFISQGRNNYASHMLLDYFLSKTITESKK